MTQVSSHPVATARPTSLALAVAVAVMGAGLLATGAARQDLLHLLVLLALAPLLEEAVFRAGLHEALLRRWPARPQLANAATAVVFGLAHAAVRGDATACAVALPAWLIGVVYQRTGRLRWCVALHAAMNAIWLAWSTAGLALPLGR